MEMDDANSSTGGVLRRLHKLSGAAFQPLHVQARALCVGPAVAFRVSMRFRSRARGDTSWVVALSQSKFHAFHAHARAVLALPANAKCCGPAGQFRVKLAEILWCYDSLHAAFGTHALVAAWRDAQRRMEAFMGDCWAALALLLPVLALDARLASAALSREVAWLCFLLRDLLALPERVVSAHHIYANAVLSIRDSDALVQADRFCSICLNGLGDEPCGEDPLSISVVRLPCRHVFHEDCLLEWFRYNPSCPECRACVGCHHRDDNESEDR